MGRLDSSETNSLCYTVLPVVWRLAGRVNLNPKKNVSDLGLGFLTIAKRRTYCCDTDDRQPTGSALSYATAPQEGRFCTGSASKHRSSHQTLSDFDLAFSLANQVRVWR